MKKIGYADRDWTFRKALQDKIQYDDEVYWAKRKVVPVKYVYKPQKLELSETARHVFGSAVHYAKLLRL